MTWSRRDLLYAVGTITTTGVAGCNTSGSPSTDATASEEPTTTTPTRTASLEEFDFPAGATETGVSDPEAIAASTVRVLNESSFDYTWHREASAGSTHEEVTARYRRDLDSKRVAYRVVRRGSDPGSGEAYIAYPDQYTKVEGEESTTYETRTVDAPFAAFGTLSEERGIPSQRDLEETLNGVLFASPAVSEALGRTVVDYEFDGFDLSGAGFSQDDLSSSDADLRVDESGLIHHALLSFEVERDGGRRRHYREFTLDGLGDVSIAPPDWVETAKRQSDAPA